MTPKDSVPEDILASNENKMFNGMLILVNKIIGFSFDNDKVIYPETTNDVEMNLDG
jgi:hypothetical protein